MVVLRPIQHLEWMSRDVHPIPHELKFHSRLKVLPTNQVIHSDLGLLSVHVLYPLADYTANVTTRAKDEAHGLYQLVQLTKVVSPTFVLTP